MKALGTQIRTIRKSLGMTQLQLADRSGLTQRTIARIERCEKKNPDIATISKLATALNCDFIDRAIPRKAIPIFLEEQSEHLARKIVAIASGSSAIEFHSPSRQVVKEQILEIKKELLGKHRSALWQKI